MNRQCSLILLITLFVASCDGSGLAAGTNVVESISISECVERALGANLEIRVERLGPSLAAWGVEREQGAFDPLWRSSLNYLDNKNPLDPLAQFQANGLSLLESQTLSASSGLSGKLATGTQYNLQATEQRFVGTITSNFVYNATLGLTLTQPLLKNFGLGANTAGLRIARVNRAVAVESLARQVSETILSVHAAYYDLVSAQQEWAARVEDLRSAERLRDENRRRAAVGFVSGLEVTQAEAGVAERREAVVVTGGAITERANTLKRLISGNVAELDDVSLVPTAEAEAVEVELDRAQSVRTALGQRPEYRSARSEVERQHIVVQYMRNQLWPEVDLMGTYGLNARSGSTTTPGSIGGLGDDLSQANNPFWSVGLVVTIPLGNRQAKADYRGAQVRAEQAVLNLKRMEQDILVQVDNSIARVRTNRQRLVVTRDAVRLAGESLAAEQEKLRAGRSTSFLVLQAQTQLADVRSAEIRARADYNKSLAALAFAEGTLLAQHHVSVEEKF